MSIVMGVAGILFICLVAASILYGPNNADRALKTIRRSPDTEEGAAVRKLIRNFERKTGRRVQKVRVRFYHAEEEHAEESKDKR
jgi:hypothetical protein